MAEVVRDNCDLDRLANLLLSYTKDTQVAYQKMKIFDIWNFWTKLGLIFLTILINIFIINNFAFTTQKWIDDDYLRISFIIWVSLNIILALFLFIFFSYKNEQKDFTKDNLKTVYNALAEVTQFASQTLEHTKLTDIRTFEFKLLLKQAEDVLQKTKNT